MGTESDETPLHLSLNLDTAEIGAFCPFLQQGFHVVVRVGCSVRAFDLLAGMPVYPAQRCASGAGAAQEWRSAFRWGDGQAFGYFQERGRRACS